MDLLYENIVLIYMIKSMMETTLAKSQNYLIGKNKIKTGVTKSILKVCFTLSENFSVFQCRNKPILKIT